MPKNQKETGIAHVDDRPSIDRTCPLPRYARFAYVFHSLFLREVMLKERLPGGYETPLTVAGLPLAL